MKLPNKITPDNLIDTVVEIRYMLNVPFELVLGTFYTVLNDNFEYVPTSVPLSNSQNQINGLIIGAKPLWMANENFKIQITENSIIFNTINQYQGWNIYFEMIKNVLQKLMSVPAIHSFNRVGIRYICKYDSISLFTKLKGKVTLFSDDFEMDNATLRFEYFQSEKRIIVNLSNNIKIEHNSSDDFYSLVDIDVISVLPNSTDIQLIHKTIDETHAKEKEIFFGLFHEDFIKTLNPEY